MVCLELFSGDICLQGWNEHLVRIVKKWSWKQQVYARCASTFSHIPSRRFLPWGIARSAQKNQVAKQICEKMLRVHARRTPLADQHQKTLLHHPARQHQQNKFVRSFCETILAIITHRSPPDGCTRQHSEDILTDLPSSQTRHFFTTSVLRSRPSSAT